MAVRLLHGLVVVISEDFLIYTSKRFLNKILLRPLLDSFSVNIKPYHVFSGVKLISDDYQTIGLSSSKYILWCFGLVCFFVCLLLVCLFSVTSLWLQLANVLEVLKFKMFNLYLTDSQKKL